MKTESAERWAALCAKLVTDGKHEIAADILATLRLGGPVCASEIKKYDTMSGDVPVLRELHKMLDEIGYESIMKMSDKRRKELEDGPPGINIPMAPFAV